MKLRTSFFNPTVLKKDITRFAPVWGLYSVALLLILMVFNVESSTWVANDFYDLVNEEIKEKVICTTISKINEVLGIDVPKETIKNI